MGSGCRRGHQLRRGADLSLVTVGFSWTLAKGFLDGSRLWQSGAGRPRELGRRAGIPSSVPRQTALCFPEDVGFSKKRRLSGLSL